MYEIKRHIKWSIFLVELIIALLLLMLSIFLTSFNNFFAIMSSAIVSGLAIYLWRLQSHKILIDDQIYFKRYFLSNYKFNFEEIREIELYYDRKQTFLKLKRSHLEIITNHRYYIYILDHFDMDEVKGLLEYISKKYDIKYNSN